MYVYKATIIGNYTVFHGLIPIFKFQTATNLSSFPSVSDSILV